VHNAQLIQNAKKYYRKNMSKTVKARLHHGADSLDLTIPAELVRKHNINEGDVFEVVDKTSKDTLIIQYNRVYKSK